MALVDHGPEGMTDLDSVGGQSPPQYRPNLTALIENDRQGVTSEHTSPVTPFTRPFLRLPGPCRQPVALSLWTDDFVWPCGPIWIR